MTIVDLLKYAYNDIRAIMCSVCSLV